MRDITIATMLLIAACASAAAAEKTIMPPGADKTVFVIGVSPPEAEITVAKGDIRDDGRFYQTTWTSPTLSARPVDHFVIGVADAGTTQALIRMTVHLESGTIFGNLTRPFVPCGNHVTMSFVAPAGKVIYLTNIGFDVDGPGMTTYYTQNVDGARAFLKAHYPDLADKLEPGHYDAVPVNAGRCAG